MGAARILVFAKEPVPGRVKTRLARGPGGLGPARAAELYRAFLTDTLAACRRTTGAETTVVFSPATARGAFEVLAGGLDLEPQAEGDLGHRLTAAFAAASRRGDGPILAIGSDAPHLGQRVLEEALERLRSAPLVLGPSRDGGYYLIGLARAWAEPSTLFAGVPWSTSGVLEATLARARALGLAASLLPQEFDVDELEDLQRLGERIAAEGPALCPHTAAELARGR